VESRISSLESVAEQTNLMMQDMMRMMERFTKTEGPTEGQQQSKEVATMTDQYKDKALRGEEQE
jgi:hypothetical protein